VIYICIPAHNEERTVGVVLWKIRQVMLDFRRDYQILVLDDASTDSTPQVLAPYARVLPLTILHNEERQGYARSLEALLREAVRRSTYPRRDIVVTLQADFTDEPADIPAMVKRIESGADIVAGATRLPRNAPRSIRWSRLGLGYLMRRFPWPEPVTDPLTGFRAYRVITLRKAIQSKGDAPLLTLEGWAANAELLRVVAPYARRIAQTEIDPRYDRLCRETRFQPWQTIRQVLTLPRAPITLAAEEPAGSSAGARSRNVQAERHAAVASNGESNGANGSPRPNGGAPRGRRGNRRRRGPSRSRQGAQRQAQGGSGGESIQVQAEGKTDE